MDRFGVSVLVESRAPGVGAAACAAALGLLCGTALSGPTTTPWLVNGPDDTAAVSAAALSGWYAAADSFEDNVEIRDVNQTLLRTITRAEISALLPWMGLNGSPDGPDSLSFSDSGRLLFIGVHDANAAGDGSPSDAILKYDTATDMLSVFTRLELSTVDGPRPHPGLLHFKGRLYVGVSGAVRVYRALMNDASGVPLFASNVTAGAMVTGLTVDREQNHVYAAWNGQISRATISGNTLSFTGVGAIANVRELAYSTHFGGVSNPGLYALASTSSPAGATVWFVPPAQARGQQAFSPTPYLNSPGVEWHDLAATADGALLISADEDAVRVADTSDTKLSYSGWTSDEFAQVVKFGRGLIAPDGEPAGWVIDGDVQLGWTRFHPATPDAACWTILLLLVNDRVNGDAAAQTQVRQILTRYAGLMPDGIAPSRSADGIFRHWIDPVTGGVKPGWDPEFATLSTMKIVLAAARARQFYPGDAAIRDAANAIICGVKNWDHYVNSGDDSMYFKGLADGNADLDSATNGFHEGFLFVDQAAAYGGSSQTVYSHWLDRSRWPVATLVTGRPLTSASTNSFLPAFVSLYELLLSADFRADAGWRTQIINLRLSNAAWTDDNGPKFNTVFSAGTTRHDWGDYHADDLGNHPGDVATFTSLLAMSAGNGDGAGRTPESVGAYQAYRLGARQTFLTGASIVYRRSNVDLTYQPNSAGMPDVALGALGLAELLSPGSVQEVLTGVYPSCTPCSADFDGDGFVTGDDFDAYVVAFEAGESISDFDGDGFVTGDDFDAFAAAFAAGC